MSFDGSGFLALARALHADTTLGGDEEACMRTVISRAYYAAFLKARHAAAARRLVRAGVSHEATRNVYKGLEDPRAKSIGENLQRLAKRRSRADYSPRVDNLAREAERAVSLAGSVIAQIEALP